MPQPLSLTASSTYSPGTDPTCDGAVSFVKGDDTRLDGDLARIVDGVPGVDAQIGQHLFDLGGVHPDRTQVLARQPGQVDVFADELAQHLEHPLHGLVQIEHLGRHGLLAGKSQELPGEIAGPSGLLFGYLSASMDRISRADRHHAQFRIAEDRPQHIVEVVGHPAGQPADRLHFLGLF
jgi:hypothetical protein